LIGQFEPQVIDRRNVPNDVANLSVRIPYIDNSRDEWSSTLKINQAVLELTHRGGGPVHIDLATRESTDFSMKEIAPVRIIRRYTPKDQMPDLVGGIIGVFVGSHRLFTEEQTIAIDNFCAANNAVVICDQTSNYFGNYRVNYTLVSSQEKFVTARKNLDLLIHIGEVSGDYWHVRSKNTWRVSEDGVIRDMNRGSLTAVFEMSEMDFFKHYTPESYESKDVLLKQYKEDISRVKESIPELPFSNPWIAYQLHDKMPSQSILHFAILNSLRAWNFFDTPQLMMSSCNVGGFGIDGCLSTILGASLAHPDKMHFAFTGDLAFFYDMNALGNRHLGSNLRIMVVNNGKGTEFRMYWHPAAQFGDDADRFVAAGGHYGNKSPEVVKAYVESLGFEYMTASNKGEFLANIEHFITQEDLSRPVVFEVFTNNEDETAAVYTLRNLLEDEGYKSRQMKNQIKGAFKSVLNGIKDTIK